MPGSLKDLETCAWHGFGGPVGVGHGDDSVSVTPDDQGWQGLGQVEPVVGANPLTSNVDHRSDGVDEGLLAVTIGQSGVAAPHLRQSVAWPPSHATGKAPRQLT